MRFETNDKFAEFADDYAFACTYYLVNEEFAEMLGLQDPVSKQEV